MGNHASAIEDMTNFDAEISSNPLKNAFRGKATVHPHIPGQTYFGDEAISVIKNQYEKRRTGTSLAYIHVPFCETRCLYCLFYQNPLRAESSAHYTDHLIRELQLWNELPAQQTDPIHAVYFGGGMPTALEPNDLFRLISAVRKYLPLANDCEITFDSLFWIAVFATLGAFIMASLGLVTALWADRYEQMGVIQTFFVMPMTFLSGVFYSCETLPSPWRDLSVLNPLYYLIDGFRGGFLGNFETNPWISCILGMLFCLAFFGLSAWLLKIGYKIKS